MVRCGWMLAIRTLVILAVIREGPSACFGQVWAHGISPQRAPNLIGGLPPAPPRPNLPLPRFAPHNILPEPMHLDSIPKANFSHENLRPSHLENRMIEMETIVKEKIAPERFVRTIQGPPKLALEVQSPRGTFGSMIFLPAMPLPRSLHHKDKMNQGDMPKLDERRSLGW